MIGSVLGDIARELNHFDFGGELSLEGAEENFALRRLETVHDAGNGASVIVAGELDQLFVHEVGISHFVHRYTIKHTSNAYHNRYNRRAGID